MPNFSKTWPLGLTNEINPPEASDLMKLDLNVTKTINASDGSTHAPTVPIVIGGAGIGGNLAAGEFWKFAADPGGKRTFSRVFTPSPVCRLFSAGLTSGGWVQGGGAGPAFTRSLELVVPDGATITAVEANVRIVSGHVSPPAKFPRMSMVRIAHANGLADFLRSDDAGDGVNETFNPLIAVGDYNALGNTSFAFTPNQNNVVDKSAYGYLIEVRDEEGGGAISGNIYLGFKITFTHTSLGLF